ncbi:Elongation of very long chain fatty acids protein 7 [Melipona quadrifasciata]|uniref:Elongation of very long chain fatty acids protein n=1 Tax=Melipona quadrifasciata TaxID=166423 RepID=A0A0N0U6R7_9HYME|nr:Elongation of very long chain fatty acids protein 7 [Melipona quadrifasciata]
MKKKTKKEEMKLEISLVKSSFNSKTTIFVRKKRARFGSMSNLIRLVVNNYNEILEVNKEIMVDSWPMMSSPGPMLCIVGTYLAFVLKVGPKMMEKRPAFQLNNLLILYNAVQVLFSIWLTLQFFEMRVAFLIFSPKCNNENPSPTDLQTRATVFFVLRKKQNQVTFLHVYHHTITSIFSWGYLKFLPGEQGALIGFLNTFVHIVMYSYYLIAALGPEYKKYLWWKKYMTWIQLSLRDDDRKMEFEFQFRVPNRTLKKNKENAKGVLRQANYFQIPPDLNMKFLNDAICVLFRYRTRSHRADFLIFIEICSGVVAP